MRNRKSYHFSASNKNGCEILYIPLLAARETVRVCEHFLIRHSINFLVLPDARAPLSAKRILSVHITKKRIFNLNKTHRSDAKTPHNSNRLLCFLNFINSVMLQSRQLAIFMVLTVANSLCMPGEK